METTGETFCTGNGTISGRPMGGASWPTGFLTILPWIKRLAISQLQAMGIRRADGHGRLGRIDLRRLDGKLIENSPAAIDQLSERLAATAAFAIIWRVWCEGSTTIAEA